VVAAYGAVRPGLLDQAVVFAGPLCVVLAGLGEVLVEGHRLLPQPVSGLLAPSAST
jgi:hypothetical protein